MITGAALQTALGDGPRTFEALMRGAGGPGPLGGDLGDLACKVALQALAGRRPDLVILATTKADLRRWCIDVLTEPSTGAGGPADLAGRIGRRVGAPGMAVSAACASGTIAMGVAARRLRPGVCSRVLVIGADGMAPFVSEGFAALHALDADRCRPFDAHRAGLALGESVAALVIEAETPNHGLPRLIGWGAAMDANHLTGPSRDGAGLTAACTAALTKARYAQPGLIVAHGTGTRYNDDTERHTYGRVWPGIAVTAWKGAIGHCLGACGITETALALLAMESGLVPGVIGHRAPDPGGNIHVLCPGRHQLPPGPVMVVNAGFGGLNGVVVLDHESPGSLAVTAHVRREARPRRLARIDMDGAGWRRCKDGQEDRSPWREPGPPERLPRLGALDALGHPDPSWGRRDPSSRALVAMTGLLTPSRNCGVILLTERGSAGTDRIYEHDRLTNGADPQRFPYTLPSTPIGETSIHWKLHGPGFAVLGADDETGRSLVADLLDDGQPEMLLARIDADQERHVAWAELWKPEP